MPAFEEVVDRFWAEHESAPPLDDARLREAEEALGVRLPGRLVQLLRVQDGGPVAEPFRAFPPPSPPVPYAEEYVEVEELCGVDAYVGRTLLDSPQLTRTWGMPPELVLLTGDGHWWVALDYRACGAAGEPRVVFWETDWHTWRELAPTFEAFVEGLRPLSEFVDDLGDEPDAPPPPLDPRAEVSMAMVMRVGALRQHVSRHEDGDLSLANTHAWLERSVSEVFRLLPPSATEPLRHALDRAQAGDGTGLRVDVEAVIAELEALLPAWLETEQHAGSFFDQEYLAEIRARG